MCEDFPSGCSSDWGPHLLLLVLVAVSVAVILVILLTGSGRRESGTRKHRITMDPDEVSVSCRGQSSFKHCCSFISLFGQGLHYQPGKLHNL